MEKPVAGGELFVVRIFGRQNQSWQGTITWTSEQQTKSFRSALEFIKLIDGAMPAED